MYPDEASAADDGDGGTPRTADEVLSSLGEDEIESVGGAACAAEIAVIIAASEKFVAREGHEAESLYELVDDFERPITLWDFDPGTEQLIPAPGSHCSDLTMQVIACLTERQTLEVATEAYMPSSGRHPKISRLWSTNSSYGR